MFGKMEGTQQKKFGATAQRAFLAHLAQTANVSASAKVAGVSTSPVYACREKSEEFRAKWHAALCEGYARLEADLLAQALSAPANNMKDNTFKQRQMKIRLGTILLAAHRASVRGETLKTVSRARDPKEARLRIETRFAEMRKRLGDDDGYAAQ